MNECPVEISFCIEEVQQRLSGFIGSPERSNISAYHEVKKGDLLARVVFAADDEEADKADEVNARKETESSVEERVIDEEEVLPDFFKVNDGVELLKKSQYIFEYIAQKNGLVHFKPDEISLTSDVYIEADVGPLTGNISYSGNIYIKGNILIGHEVNCGGDLTVGKGVEDQVSIEVQGNLEVNWGVSGQTTKINVHKNCSLGYMEKGLLLCDGNVEVRAYAFQAVIFCRGRVTVLGTGVTSKTHGALIGGRINAMKSLTTCSIGADTCITRIVIGIDLRVKVKIQKAEELRQVMERKVLISQREVGVYISAAGSTDKLVKMAKDSKEKLKQKLLGLRQKQKELNELGDKISELKRKLYPKDIKGSFLVIEEFLSPKVDLIFKEQNEIIETRLGGRNRFRLVDEEIVRGM